MTDKPPKSHTVQTPDGPRTFEVDHVNLDEHPVTLPSGQVLDEAGAERLAAEALKAAGMPLPEHLLPESMRAPRRGEDTVQD